MALTRSLFHTHMNSGGKRTGIMTLPHRVLRVPAPKAATLLTPEGIGHKGYIAKCSSGVSPAVALTLFWGGLMLLLQNGLYQASGDKMREKNHIHLLKNFSRSCRRTCLLSAQWLDHSTSTCPHPSGRGGESCILHLASPWSLQGQRNGSK